MDTPYFMVDERKLDNNITYLKQTVAKYFPNFDISYSFKTNSLPWVIRKMKECEIGAEVVSDDEYQLAIEMGYAPTEIIFNGPIKSKTQFIYAVRHQSRVNIETQREVDWLIEEAKNSTNRLSIGIRINVDLIHSLQKEATHLEGGRFGFYEAALPSVIRRLKNQKNINIMGLHLHTSSKNRSIDVYRLIAQTAVKMIDEYQLELDYLDIGGGFFFSGDANDGAFDAYFSSIQEILLDTLKKQKTTIVVEPGASLIATPISFVTSVIDTKQNVETSFVTTDGSRINIDPLMKKYKYDFSIDHTHTKKDRNLVEKQIISGFTCMEHDRLFQLKNALALEVGDKIIYKKVGSYTMTLSPLFISYFPAVYVKKTNGKTEIVRKKWTAKEYSQGGKIK